MKLIHKNKRLSESCGVDKIFDMKAAEESLSFHSSIPGYRQTNLVELKGLAKKLGIGALYVKDESTRFKLNSFKGLGGSRCVAQYMSQYLGMASEKLNFVKLCEASAKVPNTLTFCSATDGNHGHGIAWACKEMGQRCVIFLPAGSTEERIRTIQNLGAETFLTDKNYDGTYEIAKAAAEKNGWVFVQDTDNGEKSETVAIIMKGYLTLALETLRQLGDNVPTHIFLQAGCGSFAGAMVAFFCNFYKDKAPKILIAEADNAACVFKTAEKDNGELQVVEGDLRTIMAGLSCGVPCRLGWGILEQHAEWFAALPDYLAAEAMRTLARPIDGDKPIVAGESGAAGVAALIEIMTDPRFVKHRQAMGLDENAKVLCISTEGDTDKANYQRIMEGAYPRQEV